MITASSRVQKAAGLFMVALLSLAIAFAAGLTQPQEAKAATAGVKTLLKATYQDGGTVTKTISKYDVNGDGKKDAVVLTLKDSATYDVYESMTIAINGKRVKTIKGIGHGLAGQVKLITLANGKRFFYASFTGENGDGTQAVMQYRKGKMSVICSNKSIKCNSHRYLTSVKAKGNSVIVGFSPMTQAMGAGFTVNYTYKYKSGTLKRTSSTTTSLKYQYASGKYGKGWLTNAGSLQLYTSKSCKTKKFVAKKNTKMKVTAVYLKSGVLSYQVKTASGQTGWFKDKNYSCPNSHLSAGATLFNETHMAG
ncbi:MAG: hypothetical protein PUE49_03395 [Eggerthellales bacterium]|nr:hypothetical protein [Eggerthellales bacterium]